MAPERPSDVKRKDPRFAVSPSVSRIAFKPTERDPRRAPVSLDPNFEYTVLIRTPPSTQQVTSSARPEGFAQSATLVARPSGARVRSRGTERDAARAQGRGETFELPGSITNSARPKPSLSESSAKLRSATAASLARRSGAKVTGTGGASRFDGDDEKASNAERSRSSIESSQPPSPSPSDKKRAGPRVGPPPGCILIHVLDEARH